MFKALLLSEKDGKVSYWLQPGSYEQPHFKEAWSRIGHGGVEAQPDIQPDGPCSDGSAG